jgi:hypothetical protein
MAGTIAVICDLTSRYSQFWQCVANLRHPVNTALDVQPGSDRSVGRNSLVRRSLERGSEWIMFLDDDQTFSPDLLTEMLAVEQPVVAALYLARHSPFFPIAFASKDDDVEFGSKVRSTSEGSYWPLDLRNHGPRELVRIRAAGTGGMLIRSEVFRELGDIQWFTHTTKMSEDIFFSDLLHEAGIPLYVHTGCTMGHLAPAVVHPAYDEEIEEWTAGLQFSLTTSVRIPIEFPDGGDDRTPDHVGMAV